MRLALLLLLLALASVPLAAEDWTTSDGKTYHDVQVLSHDDAYVTILHQDGGGRILLSTLNPALQKRFGYDPAKAAAAIAAIAAADQRDQDALAREKSQSQALAAQGQSQVNAAVAQAALPPPPDTNAPPPGSVAANGNPADGAAQDEAQTSGNQTEIDDWGYGYSTVPYGYAYGGYGYRGYRPGWNGYPSSHSRTFTHGATTSPRTTTPASISAQTQIAQKH